MSDISSTVSRCNRLDWHHHAASPTASFNNIPKRQLQNKIKSNECAVVGIGNGVHLNNVFGVASCIQSVP
jgi:hypothetical protein